MVFGTMRVVYCTLLVMVTNNALGVTSNDACSTPQCRNALKKSIEGSGASEWRSDPIGSLRPFFAIFDESGENKMKIEKLQKCEKSIKTKYFTTFEKYIKFVEGLSSIKGQNTDSVNFMEINGGEDNVTIAPPYKFSGNYIKMMQFFLDGGSIAVSFGECLVYDIQFKDTKNLPAFSQDFSDILKDLYKVSVKSSQKQRFMFDRFSYYFGDYFFARVQIGMQFSYTRSIKSTSKLRISRKQIKSCNHRILAQSIHVNVSRKYADTDCSWRVKQQYQGDHTYRVNGGSFKDMKQMQNKDIMGNPVRYTVLPITRLLDDDLISKNNITTVNGTLVRSVDIKRWFLPLYYAKMKDYTVKNDCPHGYRLYGNWEEHYCKEWGKWKCSAKCGKGKWKNRRRVCHGCLGETWDMKREICFSKRNCTDDTSKDGLFFDTTIY